MWVCRYVRMCVYLCVVGMYACVYIYIYMGGVCMGGYVCMCMYGYVCVYTRVRVCVCVFVYM